MRTDYLLWAVIVGLSAQSISQIRRLNQVYEVLEAHTRFHKKTVQIELDIVDVLKAQRLRIEELEGGR